MTEGIKFELGQLICGGFLGTTVTPQAYHLIVDNKVSTMILSKKNTESVPQMMKLIRNLQAIALYEAKYKYPLMFAIDQEGGMMNSLFDPGLINQFPSAMGLGATGDERLIYEVLKALAEELKYVGLQIILGPVLDVVTKLSHQLLGVRSFGTTIDDVVRYGIASSKGFKDGGLLTVGKHFPGIGDASVDSLLELPLLGEDLEQLRQSNSVPFAHLIREGLLDGISAAGCGVPTVSPDVTHACLSPAVLTKLLRQEIGFDGFIISECLEMDTLYNSIGLGQGVVLAIHAGCDLVMVCHDLFLQDETLQALVAAYKNGDLEEETIRLSLKRIRRLQEKLPKWDEVLLKDFQEDLFVTYKEKFPDEWQRHKELSEIAYQRSITVVRDYANVLPLTKLNSNSNAGTGISSGETNNVLLLTPLLAPVYSADTNGQAGSSLYAGEEIFQLFGQFLSEHPNNVDLKNPFNVLHTSYTANGFTALHESLVENSKVIIVLTSEGARNMYQIGIVKYLSILCNAEAGGNAGMSLQGQKSKTLIVVATLSPYDFFYSKNIGNAYLCCYDFTKNALRELANVIMGSLKAEGVIPGEKKTSSFSKKRKSVDGFASSENSHRQKLEMRTERKWLVDEFEVNRDWPGFLMLLNNTNDSRYEPEAPFDTMGGMTQQRESYYKKLYLLLRSSEGSQKHFVIRNSSLNTVYGFVLTWIYRDEALDDNVNEGDTRGAPKRGYILALLVDKAQRLQSIGKNLFKRAVRYLKDEENCKDISLGCSFPLLISKQIRFSKESIRFAKSLGIYSDRQISNKKQIMVLDNFLEWRVPQKIFRELMVVGVRFDMCTHADKIMKLVNNNCTVKPNEEESNLVSFREKINLKMLYLESIKYIKENSISGTKIVYALEPKSQNVLGSVILFTNRSEISKFFPFMENILGTEASDGDNTLIGGIIGPVVDSTYSNLSEIINFGLICSGITFFKNTFNGKVKNPMRKCTILGINESKTGHVEGVEEIGFKKWRLYCDFYNILNCAHN